MKYKAIAAGMLAASLLAYPVSSLAEIKKFSDVRDDSFAKDAIYYLVERDVISGRTSDTFAPKGLLTRAEAATIIAKAIGLKVDPAGKPSFNDSKIIGQLSILQQLKRKYYCRPRSRRI